MNTIRAFLRGFIVFLLMITHLIPGTVKSVICKNYLPLALKMRRVWARRTLRALGVKLEVSGNLPGKGPFIFIGNHRSYTDPIIALRDIEALPVAKAEIASWPMIGYAAKATGIMWVKRDSKKSRASTIRSMEKTLKNGYSVLVYPEGTTHGEPVTQSFKKGAFRLAANLGIPIVPVAIEYGDVSNYWDGEISFGHHYMENFSKKKHLCQNSLWCSHYI